MTRVAPPALSGTGHRKTSTSKLSAILFGAFLVATLFYLKNNDNKVLAAEAEENPQAKTVADTNIIQLSNVSIPTGKTSFYHCPASASSSENSKHLMLLHGARFTKEDWKTSGILEKFCFNPNLAVTAVDLPVAADHNALKSLIDTMVEEKYITSLPIALVTPSASGLTMADWLRDGDISEIPNYIFRWIPVAPPSVLNLSKDQIGSLRNLTNFKVFAIFGDQDKMGRKVTAYLETDGGAKTLELPGQHPVYLDSPDLFVENILDDLDLLA